MSVQARLLTLELIEEEKRNDGFLKNMGVEILLKDTNNIDNKIDELMQNEAHLRR